jgi:hypothetical protein
LFSLHELRFLFPINWLVAQYYGNRCQQAKHLFLHPIGWLRKAKYFGKMAQRQSCLKEAGDAFLLVFPSLPSAAKVSKNASLSNAGVTTQCITDDCSPLFHMEWTVFGGTSSESPAFKTDSFPFTRSQERNSSFPWLRHQISNSSCG